MQSVDTGGVTVVEETLQAGQTVCSVEGGMEWLSACCSVGVGRRDRAA